MAAFDIFSGENVIFKLALLTMPDGANFLSTWDSGTAYVVDDVVILDEVAYICTAGNTNQTPPNITYWDPLSGTPVADILNFKFELVSGGSSHLSYFYDGVTMPPMMTIVDGMAQVELLAADTVGLRGTYEVRITVTVADVDYFDSAGQTDVVCVPDVIAITPC